jgi:hypothetical protein
VWRGQVDYRLFQVSLLTLAGDSTKSDHTVISSNANTAFDVTWKLYHSPCVKIGNSLLYAPLGHIQVTWSSVTVSSKFTHWVP